MSGPGTAAFFALTRVRAPEFHRAYNELHQLDHRPENLALEGVEYGERWVVTPGCAELCRRDAAFPSPEYFNIYWFREPAATSIESFTALAARSVQSGRSSTAYIETLFTGHLDVVRTWVAPRLPISPAALTRRPSRGVYIRLVQFADVAALASQALHRWHDRDAIAAALACPGVAGAQLLAANTERIAPGPSALPPGLRLAIYFLDGDPLAVSARLREVIDGAPPELVDAAQEKLLFEGPATAIRPWEWSWFD